MGNWIGGVRVDIDRPRSAIDADSDHVGPASSRRRGLPIGAYQAKGLPATAGGARRKRPGPGIRARGRVTGNTVTIRDRKGFAGPLALPRSCPPYVRDQWVSRTHDRMLWWPAPSSRMWSRGRSGGIFLQFSTIQTNATPDGEEASDGEENPAGTVALVERAVCGTAPSQRQSR